MEPLPFHQKHFNLYCVISLIIYPTIHIGTSAHLNRPRGGSVHQSKVAEPDLFLERKLVFRPIEVVNDSKTETFFSPDRWQ